MPYLREWYESKFKTIGVIGCARYFHVSANGRFTNIVNGWDPNAQATEFSSPREAAIATPLACSLGGEDKTVTEILTDSLNCKEHTAGHGSPSLLLMSAIFEMLLRHIPSQEKEGHIIPYLRLSHDPKFKTIGEGVQFYREMLKGLQSIRHNHICPFSARYRSRTERPPKHYFINFGLSILYKPEELVATVRAVEGGDKSVPEFVADSPDWRKRTLKRDPFAVDVHYLDNAFRAFLRRREELRGMLLDTRCGLWVSLREKYPGPKPLPP
ncbi:hypothetical protein F5146DRAFT_1123696 [Armillaria mellea]|nr:hypothetical protein F5146DRAFT_1123696 [Armillaria mellea]